MKSLVLSLLLISAGAFAQESVTEATRLLESKHYDQAKKILESIAAHDQSNGEACFQLGRLLAEHYQDYDGAEKYLEQAVESSPGSAEYHYTLGRLYGIQAQVSSIFSKLSYAGKVKSEFLRAVELNPDNVSYRNGLLNFYLRAPGIAGGSVEKAKEQAAEIVRRDAYAGHVGMAQIAMYEKEYETAEREYLAAIRADPSKPSAYNYLGYLYLQLKRIDDAIVQFKDYVKNFPQEANSYDSLADGYTAKGDIESALPNYLKALSINPTFPSSLFGAARCYDSKGQTGYAIEYFKKFLAGTPKGNMAETAEKRLKELSQ